MPVSGVPRPDEELFGLGIPRFDDRIHVFMKAVRAIAEKKEHIQDGGTPLESYALVPMTYGKNWPPLLESKRLGTARSKQDIMADAERLVAQDLSPADRKRVQVTIQPAFFFDKDLPLGCVNLHMSDQASGKDTTEEGLRKYWKRVFVVQDFDYERGARKSWARVRHHAALLSDDIMAVMGNLIRDIVRDPSTHATNWHLYTRLATQNQTVENFRKVADDRIRESKEWNKLNKGLRLADGVLLLKVLTEKSGWCDERFEAEVNKWKSRILQA